MKNVDIFVANRMRIIENLTASKSEIFHRNFVIAGGKIIKILLLQGANSSKLCYGFGCQPSAFRIRNTLFLFAISSFICWCASKLSENGKRKLEAVSKKK